jgi:hypothetical protein
MGKKAEREVGMGGWCVRFVHSDIAGVINDVDVRIRVLYFLRYRRLVTCLES